MPICTIMSLISHETLQLSVTGEHQKSYFSKTFHPWSQNIYQNSFYHKPHFYEEPKVCRTVWLPFCLLSYFTRNFLSRILRTMWLEDIKPKVSYCRKPYSACQFVHTNSQIPIIETDRYTDRQLSGSM